jgi:hypothetical protein
MTLRYAALAATILAGLVCAQPALARGGMGAGIGNGIGGSTSGRIPPAGTSGAIPGSAGVPTMGAAPMTPPLASPMTSPMSPARPAPIPTTPSIRSLNGLSLAPPPPPMPGIPPATFQAPYTPPCGVPPLPQC